MNLDILDGLAGKLRNTISHERYIHSLGVAYTACALAMCYKYEPCERAFITGLLHDCAKYPDKEKMMLTAEENMVYLSEYDYKNPSLIHAKLGPIVAQEEYGIFDEEVQNAIKNHTTGAPNMDLLSKIIYVADYIEPNRDGILPHITKIQETAFEDLDKAVFMVMENTLLHLEEAGKEIDPTTQTAYDFYKKLIENREN